MNVATQNKMVDETAVCQNTLRVPLLNLAKQGLYTVEHGLGMYATAGAAPREKEQTRKKAHSIKKNYSTSCRNDQSTSIMVFTWLNCEFKI
jgi:DNA-binding transcriptional regulator YhcF (GntR family)